MENDRPRVYSVDEIVPGVYGWMDCPNWDHTTICEINEIEKSENETTVFCGHWMPIESLNEYGKSDGWRLWNKKPTMHERQMWPWHGEPSKMIKFCFKVFGWTYYDDEEELAMDFVDFIKEFDRMCLYYMGMPGKCKSCPMECSNISQCRKEAFERPEHVESIVKSWSKKNPTKYPNWFEYLNEFLTEDELFKPIPDHIALLLDLKKR